MDASKYSIARLNLDIEIYTPDLKTKDELESAWAYDKVVEIEGLTCRVVDMHAIPKPEILTDKFEPLIWWFQLKFWATKAESDAILKNVGLLHKSMIKR